MRPIERIAAHIATFQEASAALLGRLSKPVVAFTVVGEQVAAGIEQALVYPVADDGRAEVVNKARELGWNASLAALAMWTLA